MWNKLFGSIKFTPADYHDLILFDLKHNLVLISHKHRMITEFVVGKSMNRNDVINKESF